MSNPFVHVELHTGDLPKAKEFYSKLFDWKFDDVPIPGGMSYTMITVGEGTGGGMVTSQSPDVPPHWMAYVGVDDVKASTANAIKPGATVLQEVMEVGDYGLMSIITDPTGASIALWQSKPRK